MANITITIPDAVASRVTDDLCGAYGFETYKETGGTMTKVQFAKQCVIDFIKTTCKNYEGKISADNAIHTVHIDVDSLITLT